MTKPETTQLAMGLSEPSTIVTVEVNGRQVTAQVPTRLNVADFLRHRLGLTGTHVGCEQGVCGMCSVIVDGVAVKSCLMFTGQLDGCSVQTVESLGDEESLSPLQQCFKDSHGLQCGFCTPAMLMTVTALAEQPGAAVLSREEIQEEIAGVLCRCTGYKAIVDAAEAHLRSLGWSTPETSRSEESIDD